MATTFPVEQAPSTSFKIQHSSPLDSLVRRTSAKRARAPLQSTASQQYPTPLIDDYTTSQDDGDVDNLYGGYAKESPLNPPRSGFQQHQHQQVPASPILHSHFGRSSTATPSITGSYWDARSSVNSRNTYQELEHRYRADDESVYSQVDSVSPALHDSWASSQTMRPYNPKPVVSVPAVVVSSPEADSSRAGRTPIVRPTTANFSRPVRLSQHQVAASPQNTHEQKRRVLERNASRTPQDNMRFFHRNRSPNPPPPPSPPNPYLSSPVSQKPTNPIFLGDLLPNPYADQPPQALHRPNPNGPQLQRTPSPHLPPDYQSLDRPSPPPSPSPLAGSKSSLSPSELIPVTLPRRPPSRSDSPVSLYSAYSYYDFENTAPSPVDDNLFGPPSSRSSPGPQHQQQQPPSEPKRLQPTLSLDPHLRSPSLNNSHHSRTPSPLSAGVTAESRQTPQDYLQLGIQNHEANRLKESAMYFEKSSKVDGGCGVGMLMWGLALRHGWGCEKNEKVGFKWLRKAAESAVVDLESARGGNNVDITPVQVSLAHLRLGRDYN